LAGRAATGLAHTNAHTHTPVWCAAARPQTHHPKQRAQHAHKPRTIFYRPVSAVCLCRAGHQLLDKEVVGVFSSQPRPGECEVLLHFYLGDVCKQVRFRRTSLLPTLLSPCCHPRCNKTAYDSIQCRVAGVVDRVRLTFGDKPLGNGRVSLCVFLTAASHGPPILPPLVCCRSHVADRPTPEQPWTWKTLRVRACIHWRVVRVHSPPCTGLLPPGVSLFTAVRTF
jgi:hypothetical protein